MTFRIKLQFFICCNYRFRQESVFCAVCHLTQKSRQWKRQEGCRLRLHSAIHQICVDLWPRRALQWRRVWVRTSCLKFLKPRQFIRQYDLTSSKKSLNSAFLALCVENSQVVDRFPSQRARNAGRFHVIMSSWMGCCNRIGLKWCKVMYGSTGCFVLACLVPYAFTYIIQCYLSNHTIAQVLMESPGRI